jgi:hypothetical protein
MLRVYFLSLLNSPNKARNKMNWPHKTKDVDKQKKPNKQKQKNNNTILKSKKDEQQNPWLR